MRIQQMRKVFGGTRAAPTTNRTPGWLREFASGVAAGNLVRHGAGVPGAHDSRICERPRLGPAPAGRHASER
ncbi:hypothetical protein HWD35_23595 [Tsukamurella tyrosinosolvens]|uniref:hypothetical protein n=2 Tax=Tsukamurella tyrosinosolvens TaxID=57704 RepID=UPI0012E846DC|nr:hypothetical protein [Tsukamurella tyrosinosolvens]MCA4997709.1 hypothetical protein [Tsukamurella tyrosinosolvens]MEC4615870.1 hypothetical protein [Tsukamurella tyrosinosolvens]QRY85178.1 hypothetical protein JVY00_03485 [Tsukamurella tyrosinosolvens]WEL93112.1 hypothetical protein P1N98_18485 [Tsukamurella tyrosinosolvens]